MENVNENPTQRASELFASALQAVATQNKVGASDGTRLFFPNGIELVSLTFKLAQSAEIQLLFAGKDQAPRGVHNETVAPDRASEEPYELE